MEQCVRRLTFDTAWTSGDEVQGQLHLGGPGRKVADEHPAQSLDHALRELGRADTIVEDLHRDRSLAVGSPSKETSITIASPEPSWPVLTGASP